MCDNLNSLVPVSTVNQAGKLCSAIFFIIGSKKVALPVRIERTFPGIVMMDGMLTGFPLRLKWPWRTNWRASLREVARPARKTTLSNLLSKMAKS